MKARRELSRQDRVRLDLDIDVRGETFREAKKYIARSGVIAVLNQGISLRQDAHRRLGFEALVHSNLITIT
jgi:hypothetical protein